MGNLENDEDRLWSRSLLMSRTAPKPRLLILVAGLLCRGMASCAPTPEPTQNDIVGTWDYSPAESTYVTKALDGRIEFKSDGTFELHQIPADIISVIGPEALTSESGTWKILEEQTGIDQPVVNFSTSGSALFPDRRKVDLVVKGSGDSRRLVGMAGGLTRTKTTYS
ncbi:hypothetical protein AAIH32_03885 [Pseudarthrobacter oxydans]|uniref:hypothetical protein n=1 Tax=Pseudarthrobacter oxydans TaxID=1671 RepID=UPI003D2D2C63